MSLMQRLVLAFVTLLFVGVGVLRADQITAAVQQVLKEQGFYYGQVTGEKDADTNSAIRRYQIRNGLQITGEIDAETLRSLGVRPETVRRGPRRETESPAEGSQSDTGEAPTQSAEINPPPDYRAPAAPAPGYGLVPRSPHFNQTDIFANTPYEMAPPDLQRHVIVGAQTLLARYGFYRNGIDGEFGPATAAALRDFQARTGLVPDGRLNMATLAALGLLPGQHAPGAIPRQRFFGRPVYPGQWIPDR